MQDVIDAVAAAAHRGEAVALASLVESSGSIPMSDRAKMIVCADGSTVGTIGGGCLEAEIIAVGRGVLASGQPRMTRYTMTEEQAGEGGLNCGGTVSIYTELVEGEAGESFQRLVRLRGERTACALASVLMPPAGAPLHALYLADGAVELPFGDRELETALAPHVAAALARDRAEIVSPAEGVEVFVEPFAPPPVLYVFGGGHVGGHLGRLAQSVGFEVTIVDDRPAFASRQRHPLVAHCLVLPMDRALTALPVDEGTYIVAATRGHQHDEVVVEQAIRTRARYVGMLGSERKKLILWDRIAARGGDRRRLERVYAPVGHNIGADTPEEIAVSVVAELIEVRRGPRRPWKTKRPAGPAAAAT